MATFDTIIITASGSGDDAGDIKAVRLYLDNNADGVIDSGDTQLGSDQLFTDDDGNITFSELNTAVTGGDSIYIIVAYDIELAMSYSGYGLSIVSANERNKATDLFFAGMLLLPLALLYAKRKLRRDVIALRAQNDNWRGRFGMRKLMLVVIILLGVGLSACGDSIDGTSDDGTGGGTSFAVSVTDNQNIGVEASVSKSAVGVSGAPITSNTLTVK